MVDLDGIREIFHTLWKNPVRTFFTGLGVFWGLLIFVLMLGAGNGLQRGVASNFEDFASNAIFAWSQTTTKAYAGFKPGRRIELTNEDTRYLIKNIPEIDVISPRNQLGSFGGGNNIGRGGRTGNFKVYGDYPAYNQIDHKTVLKGRMINEKDITDYRKTCVIGTRVQSILFEKDEDPIGDYIKINNVYFQIVGVFKPGKGPMSRSDGDVIFTPFTTFQRAFNYGNQVGWFALTAKPDVDAKKVELEIERLLKIRHKISPEDDGAIGSFNVGKEFKKMNNAFVAIEYVNWVVGILTLLAGVIGVSNIMLVTVTERTKEFGIKRALGARPWTIIKQLISESILLTAIAGFFGSILGMLVLEGLRMMSGGTSDEGMTFFKDPSVQPTIILSAFGILIIAGVIAGIIPALRAMQIKPIEALRTE